MNFNFELIDDNNRKQCLSLYEFFEINCSISKGSSHNHQYWEGGYFDHIVETTDYAIKLYSSLSNRQLPFTLSDALLILLLHDIEKPIKYSELSSKYPSDSDEIRKYLISKFQFNLSEEHINALKYIHGEGSDYNKSKRIMSPLSAFCHCCDIISARIFFDYPNQHM